MPGSNTSLPLPGKCLLAETHNGTQSARSKKGKSVAANIGLFSAFDEALKKEMGGAAEARRCEKGGRLPAGQGKKGPAKQNVAQDASASIGGSIVTAKPVALGGSGGSKTANDKPEATPSDPGARVHRAAVKREAEKTGVPAEAKEGQAGAEGEEKLKAPAFLMDGRAAMAEKKMADSSSFGDIFQKGVKQPATSPSQGLSERRPDRAVLRDHLAAASGGGDTPKTDPPADEQAGLRRASGKAPLTAAQESPLLTVVRDGEALKNAEPLQSGPATPGKEKGKEPEGLKTTTAPRGQLEPEERSKGAVPSWSATVTETGMGDPPVAKDRIRSGNRLEVKAVAEGSSPALRGDETKTQKSPADGNAGGQTGDGENAWKAVFSSAKGGRMDEAEPFSGKLAPKEQPVTKSEKAAVSAERPDLLAGLKDTGDQKSSALRALSSPAAEAPDPQSLFARIVENSEELVRTGQNRVRLTLTPPQLGTLDLDLVVERDQVRMVLTTENKDVCQVLQSNLDQLKTVLQGQGFDIDRLDVFVQDRGERGNGMARGEMSFGREHSGSRADGGAQEEPLAVSARRNDWNLLRGEEGISIFA